MPSPKPTAILVVQGAYFLPSAWDASSHDLSQRGLQCPVLPTCGETRPSQALLAHEVAAVRSTAEDLVAETQGSRPGSLVRRHRGL